MSVTSKNVSTLSITLLLHLTNKDIFPHFDFFLLIRTERKSNTSQGKTNEENSIFTLTNNDYTLPKLKRNKNNVPRSNFLQLVDEINLGRKWISHLMQVMKRLDFTHQTLRDR